MCLLWYFCRPGSPFTVISLMLVQATLLDISCLPVYQRLQCLQKTKPNRKGYIHLGCSPGYSRRTPFPSATRDPTSRFTCTTKIRQILVSQRLTFYLALHLLVFQYSL